MTKLFLAIATALLGQAVPPAQEPKHDVSDKEGLDFARRIELDQAAGRESAFDDFLDLEGLVEEESKGLDLSIEEKADFIKGARKSSIGKSIGLAQGSTYTFLSSRRADGRLILTFRLWGDGLNYHDLRIRKTPDGLRIADLRIYLSGEWLGQTARRTLMMVAASKPDRAAKLPASAAEWLKHWRDIQAFVAQAAQGEPAKALAAFDRFPDSVRKDRMLQTLRLLASSKVGEAAYLKAADEYTRLFPEDGCRDIACMDGLIIRKDFARAFESIDRIGKAVGGDPILDVVRARLHVMQGKFQPARDAALQAMKNLPKLQDPHLVLIEVTLKEKKYGETVERINALEKALDLKVQPEEVEADPGYAEFVKSPEYREWKQGRASK